MSFSDDGFAPGRATDARTGASSATHIAQWPGAESDAGGRLVALRRAAGLWLGAATAVALVGGLGFWVWDIATRDSRTVPVVRAMEGPARTAPETPGGFRAENQGFAVNSVASDDEGVPLAERITLAPPPTTVSDADLPGGRPPPEMGPEMGPERPEAEAIRASINNALRTVLGEAGPAPGAEADEDDTLARSPRPDSRLAARQRAARMPAPDQPVADAASLDVDPATLRAGTRLVRLGAYASDAEARAAWRRLQTRMGPRLADKRRVIETVEGADGALHRLGAVGFADLSEAERFCAAAAEARTECAPVLVR